MKVLLYALLPLLLLFGCTREQEHPLARELRSYVDSIDARIGIAVNDVGYVLLPDGRRYSIAVFVNDSALTPEQTEAVIARISSIVFNSINGSTD